MKIFIIIFCCSILTQYAELAIPGVTGPLHASCKVAWNWPETDCKLVHLKIVNQINEWKTDENCKNGGEKCLYTLVSQDEKQIKATHSTPVKHYIDDLSFDFNQLNKDCQVNGFSTSETWYAVLDYGTNYCNLHNLITGSGLDKIQGFIEKTSNDICTQFTSADCEKY
ncbi:hypothetical protein BpHYR1_036009 [Brachionus plicatilis]|uniref:Uncharacterized protein n=1 Tax=Brachionus plicatilis TaxID=10195 RepID=A0A3M7SXK2_BRAPC|nr:hypothetical protein BpHYR1_036009 [Brachionus plicatilis]RNA40534.1 hypothetical protein BpHYR1_036009 [Brachionus plicatilis]